MKPTQEQVIAWAREAGLQCAKNYDYRGLYEAMPLLEQQDFDKVLLALTLAYEAGQESMKWDGIHSCHPDCQRPACVHTRKTYQEGYEAGRKDENEAAIEIVARHGGSVEIEVAIRARREQ